MERTKNSPKKLEVDLNSIPHPVLEEECVIIPIMIIYKDSLSKT
jgi:hypothetical protein